MYDFKYHCDVLLQDVYYFIWIEVYDATTLNCRDAMAIDIATVLKNE
jgi:hypothetical protein